MRTTLLSLWSKQAKEFDTLVGQTVFQCLGLKPTDEAHEQASVSTTIGEFEGQVITGETWVKPPEDCSSVYQSQQRASSATDTTILTKLKTNANLREAQRLPCLDSPHANAWISARPSSMDGTDTILPPGSTGLPLPVSTCVL